MRGMNLDLHISRPIRILMVFFVVVVFIMAVYLPAERLQRKAAAQVASARKEYAQAVTLVNRYQAVMRQNGEADLTIREGQLFSYLESVTRDLNLGSRIDSIRPENRDEEDGTVTEAAHVSFKGIDLDEFINFLYHIEVLKKEIYIEAISIKKDGKSNLITQMTLRKFN